MRANGQAAAARLRVRASEKPRILPVSELACTPVAMPPELRAWRERHPGSIVSVGQTGVTLIPFGSEPRVFPTVSAAITAIESPNP